MVNFRKFTLSCKLFWGYSLEVDLDYFDTVDDIIKHVLENLKLELQKLNLVELNEILEKEKNNFHIHNCNDIGFLLLSNETETIYICNHTFN